ncbi:MAG: hypothetical protein J1E06_08180 [Acutalibacter sp.]|nr:hypothetical protein [Acutalibacter sp.]
MRRLFAWVLIFMMLIIAPVQAFAEGTETGEAGDDSFVTSEPEPTPVPGNIRRVKLTIDNENIYKDMAKSYSQGYVPSISGGYAVVVLPLLCDGELRDDRLRAAVTLGDTSSSPFVGKNYEKTVSLAAHEVNGGKKTVQGYCVSFSLQLKTDRYNGTYPVSVRISGEDQNYEDVTGDFTVFVTITDGKDPNAVPTPEPVKEEDIVLGPKILVQSCEAESLEEGGTPGKINAGDRMQVKITLENTSKTEGVENMTVTVGSPGDGFLFTGASDSTYVDSLPAGGTVDVIRTYTVKPETSAGQYEIPVSFDFAYGKGMTGTGSGTARVDISQPLEMEFSLLQMPAEAVVSDTVEVNVQAINLSRAKAYNVRAAIEGDGLSPAGTAFIGDLEGGTAQQIPLQILIAGLSQGNSFYGPTEGKITYQYEDGEGTEYSLEETFSLNIRSPFSDTPQQPEDEPGQWWVLMAVMAGALLLIAVFLGARKIRGRRAR